MSHWDIIRRFGKEAAVALTHSLLVRLKTAIYANHQRSELVEALSGQDGSIALQDMGRFNPKQGSPLKVVH